MSENGKIKTLYTINELCEHLRVTRATLYRIINAGDLKPVKVGYRLRFRQEDVDKYLLRDV